MFSAALAALVPLFLPAPRAGPDALDLARASARTELVARLLTHAAWSQENELYAERNRAWGRVIAIDADNPDARKGLRFARNADGSWKEPAPRPAKNRNAKAEAEIPARRAEVVGPFREAMLALIEKERPSSDLRRAMLDEVLGTDPDDAVVRDLLGEARTEAGWVLKETAVGKERRAAIRAAALKAGDASVPLERVEETALEKGLGAQWTCAVGTGSVRVLATTDAGEGDKIARACAAVPGVVAEALGRPVKLAEPYTVYVLGPAGRDAFVDAWPGLQPDERERLKGWAGGGIPRAVATAVWDADPRKRLDCASLHAIVHALRAAVGIGPEHGWALEGLGLYLNREVCGTRFAWFTGAALDKKNKLTTRLVQADANWMNEAFVLLSGPGRPDLEAGMEKDVSQVGVAEMLASYALAAYLLEGRPAEAPVLLERIASGTKPVAAIREVLGMSVHELQERLVRWLSERK